MYKEIKKCINVCPFFNNTMDGMECNHPYFDNRTHGYANMIIQQTDKKTIPLKCPLRKESLTIILAY